MTSAILMDRAAPVEHAANERRIRSAAPTRTGTVAGIRGRIELPQAGRFHSPDRCNRFETDCRTHRRGLLHCGPMLAM